MLVKLLVSRGVTGLLLSAAMGVAPVAAQQPATLASDSSFIQMAGSLGLLQARLGKLAETKGSSPAVKDFGKRMVTDYEKANEELAAAAKQAAYPSPLLLRQHQQLADRFGRMSQSSFDKNYMAEMVKHHGEAVALFRQEAENGRVASLKALAARMLPDLQQQRSLAVQTAGAVGADVTASTSEAKQGSGTH
jgi:putative membrane protein